MEIIMIKSEWDKKYLLITSDDFGMSHGSNLGVLEGFQNGILQSASLMVPCPWFSEALKMSIEFGLPVGIHLTLTCEWDNMKWGPLTRAASLTDRFGYFHSSFQELMQHAKEEEILKEYRAQIERALELGIRPTHVDTHMLTSRIDGKQYNMNVAILAKMVASEYNLRYSYAVKEGELIYFNSEFILPENNYAALIHHLDQIDPGIHHLICQCGFGTEEQKALSDTDSMNYRWAAQYREKDLQTITSKRFRKYLADNDIEVIDAESWNGLLNSQI